MKLRLAFIIAIITLAAISGFTVVIGDSTDSQYEPIEAAEANPEVDDNGVFRLLTSNDIDENRTETHADIYNVSARDTQTRTASENSSVEVVRIDDTTFTIEQARQYARLTDGYRETLYTDTRIPTNDSWVDGSEVTIEGTSFIGFGQNETVPEHSGEDGYVYVEIESEPGQLPARNVEVLAEDTPDDEAPGDLYIANPDEIEVYDGEMKNYEQINQNAAEGSFYNTSLDLSMVPGSGNGNQTARYDVGQEKMSGKWHGKETVIKDHYGGVARITEGALYDGYWLVNPDGINVTMIHDYRAVKPYTENNQYTEDAPECSYDCNCDEDGCETCHATPERYEYYENKTLYQSFTELYHNGTFYGAANSTKNIFPIDDPSSGALNSVSTITVTYNRTYGVDYPSACPDSDWEKEEVEYISHGFSRDASYPLEPATASDLNITAYIKNTESDQEVYFDIVGNQRPAENPLGRVQLTANDGQDVWTVHSPWIAYPQSLYSQVEKRTEQGDTWESTHNEIGASPHNLHRDYLDANSYKNSPKSTMVVGATRTAQSQTYEGINVGENVINGKGDVALYRTIGGTVYSTASNERITESDVNATATDLFGNKFDVDTKFVEYERSELDIELVDDGNTIEGALTDTNGTGIPNREISLSGANQTQTTTDSSGEFRTSINSNVTTITAEFEGDTLRENPDQHYEGDTARTATANFHINAISGPMKYLSAFISNLLVVIHWIVLGLFFVWWTKFRNGE